MDQERFDTLFDKFKRQHLSQEEWDELRNSLKDNIYDEEILQFIDESWDQYRDRIPHTWTEDRALKVWSKITDANSKETQNDAQIRKLEETTSASRTHLLKTGWYRYAAAAVLLFVLAGSAYWFIGHPSTHQSAQVKQYKNDVAPGHNGAVLTLSNGQKIILDNTGNGLVTSDEKVQVIKKDGEISYQGKAAELVYNTIATDKGRQWMVTLPDGSKVWLNAASSIRYPLSFTGNERMVEITGEAYFEVAHNAKKPFVVKTTSQEITVLGTHFNINAYDDEASSKTTLLEGSVKITGGSASVIIKPGEQASRVNGGTSIKVLPADVEAVIAWKNGIFELSNADVASIMRQISRWYDIEVIYKGNPPRGTISGEVPRNLNLSEVLKVLALSGVQCEIEGRKLTVSD